MCFIPQSKDMDNKAPLGQELYDDIIEATSEGEQQALPLVQQPQELHRRETEGAARPSASAEDGGDTSFEENAPTYQQLRDDLKKANAAISFFRVKYEDKRKELVEVRRQLHTKSEEVFELMERLQACEFHSKGSEQSEKELKKIILQTKQSKESVSALTSKLDEAQKEKVKMEKAYAKTFGLLAVMLRERDGFLAFGEQQHKEQTPHLEKERRSLARKQRMFASLPVPVAALSTSGGAAMASARLTAGFVASAGASTASSGGEGQGSLNLDEVEDEGDEEDDV